jgi:tetratricopeptide (TPR) repeat protein
LGIIHREKEEYSKAQSILKKAIFTIEENDPENINLALLYSNLGVVYCRIKDFSNASNYLTTALEVSYSKQDNIGMMSTLIHFGELEQQKGEIGSSIDYFRKVYEQSGKMEAITYQHISCERLIELYKEKQMNDSVLFFWEEKIRLEKLIDQSEAEKHLLTEELKLAHNQRTEKLFEEIDRKDKNFYSALFALLIFFCLIMGILWKSRINHTRLNLELMDLRLKSESQNLEGHLLKSQLEDRDKKLTSSLVYSLKRNELLQESVQKLIEKRKHFNKEGQDIVRGIIQNLSSIKEEKIFKEFESSFVNIHLNFYENLLKDYPNLTLNEKRLCAFIRLNLASKEIMVITGQTLTTFNVAKTRLRKKLGITNNEIDLYNFLAKY